MNKKHFYAAVILLLFLAAGIQPAVAIDIPTDESVGTWDPVTSTYTLNTNVTEGLVIVQSNFTLNGAGHTVDGTGSGYGVYVVYKSDVTIMNLNVQNFDTGINIQYSDNITLTGNTVSGCDAGTYSCGIYLNYTYESDLTNNTVSNNSYGIRFYVTYSDLEPDQGNTLTNNTVLYNTYGIDLHCYIYNTLTNNTISYNDTGIRVFGSSNNTIYNNNFIDNGFQASVEGGSGNVFNLELPIGGNYWSDYTGVDNDGDGFGDTPYSFDGGQDDLPIFSAKLAIIQLIDMVEGLNAKEGIINSLDAKLQNALDALDAANAGQRQDAINKMEAFINSAEAQSGNQISVDDANALIAFAEYIIGML